MGRGFGFGGREVHIEGPSLGYILAAETAKSVVVLRPFIFWPLGAICSAVLHHFWADNGWVIAFMASVSVFMAVFVWFLTRNRRVLGYMHAMITVLLAGMLLCLVDAIGWVSFTEFAVSVGIPILCLTWSMRVAVRDHDHLDSAALSGLFDKAGMPGTRMQVHSAPASSPLALPGKRLKMLRRDQEIADAVITDSGGKTRRERLAPQKVKATIHLQPGETVDTLARRTRSIESAAGWAPGTMTVTQHEDHAGKAHVILSDPRAIKKPIPWPGPSYTNASIADPVSVGVYQDGAECEFMLPETQLQIMGQVGSGKSLGGAWSTLAEVITRDDVIVWAIDVTKGMQTLGPLASALHRIATTPEEAISLLEDANALIKPRTDYLAEKGLGKWKKGCGLKYLVVWIEEVPEVMEALGDDGEELWIKSVKAARSAGITFAWSLQRADYSQIPTITRGQAVKWCFGVADSHEASFGLSEAQSAANCEPELWGQRQPGMCYLDAPSIPDDKIPMALRTWYWGPDDSVIKEHAGKFPASDKPYDEVMLKVLGIKSRLAAQDDDDEPGEDEECGDDMADEELDSEPEPLDGDFDLVHNEPEPMEPVAARQKVREWLVDRAGETVRNVDLTELRLSIGRSRTWGYQIMEEFERSGLVRRIDQSDGIGWKVTADREILVSGVASGDVSEGCQE